MSFGSPPPARPSAGPSAATAAQRDEGRLWLTRSPLVLGAATGIMICVVALAVLYVLSGRAASPEVTGQALCADLQAQRYDAAYDLLAPSLRSTGTAAQFTASQRELDTLRGKVVSCTAAIQQSDGAQATLRLTVARQQSSTAQGIVHLRLVDGVWKVDAYDPAVV